jgi:integrase
MFVRFGKSTLKFKTEHRILPKYWNPNTPENHFRKFTGSPEMNTSINNHRTKVNKLYYSRESWTVDELKTQLLAIVNDSVPKDTEKVFTAALKEFIQSKEANNELAKTTIQKYKTLQSHLNDFSDFRKFTLNFERVNKKLFEDFSGYLRNEKKHTNTTVNKYLKTLKTFIHWAIDYNYASADTVSTKFKISEETNDVIFLTWEELMSLYNLDLSAGSSLAKVRDVFCFGCFTGQRFSDISNLKRADIVNGYWILHQIKVKDTVSNEIFLNEFASAILDKYSENVKPLPVISNQKTNEYLKKLGKEAKINEVVKVVRYRGNERLEVREPKYKLLGTHTARRTFITLSLEKGMRPETVMGISGHTDYKSMSRYLAVTGKMKRNEMEAIWKAEIDAEDVETSKQAG